MCICCVEQNAMGMSATEVLIDLVTVKAILDAPTLVNANQLYTFQRHKCCHCAMCT